jgi:hypothetical protein
MNDSSQIFLIEVRRLLRNERAIAMAECGGASRALVELTAVPPAERTAEDWDLIARLLTEVGLLDAARDSWGEAGCAGMDPGRVKGCLEALECRRHSILIVAALAGMGLLLSIVVLGLLLAVLLFP